MATTKGLFVPAGGGKHLDMSAPGRFADLKLLREQTGDSIMLFEESLPEGEMTFKIGDEVRVGGPGTCAFLVRNVPHAWKNSGPGTARVLFLYTPALAGGYIEEMLELSSPMSAEDQARLCKTYSWEFVGPNPL
jgi:hypothetical protein